MAISYYNELEKKENCRYPINRVPRVHASHQNKRQGMHSCAATCHHSIGTRLLT
jgi:hypothetical protein